jgi:secondary thiamine-phosphate synthase enzyme
VKQAIFIWKCALTNSVSILKQYNLSIKEKSRGFHLITDELLELLPNIGQIKVGLLHLFIQHTSASISINENTDPTVRIDLENHLNRMVPENPAYYLHTDEGIDDMPAHIKASMIGNNLMIPISNGHLALGLWQGIYLGEHRNFAGKRRLIATVLGG